MTITESKIRDILKSLDNYIQVFNDFNAKIETAKHTPPVETVEKRVARIEADRDIKLEPIQKNVMAHVDAMIQEEVDYVATRKAAEIRTLINGSSDYNTRLANAIKVIEILGDDMTAEQLQDIIDPFVAALEYSALRTLKAVAEKCCPQLFQPFTNGKVNFGPLPGDKLEFLKGFKALVERVFQDTDKGFAFAYAEGRANKFFGSPDTNAKQVFAWR